MIINTNQREDCYSAVFVIIISIVIGTKLSSTTILDFIATTPSVGQTQQETTQPTDEMTAEIPEIWKKEGNTYTTEVTYLTPAGQEKHTLIITVVENMITEFAMTVQTTDPVSKKYQTDFTKSINELIATQPITQIANLDAVAGASLTTKAFTDALSQLKL